MRALPPTISVTLALLAIGCAGPRGNTTRARPGVGPGDITTTARSFEGAPYRYGGTSGAYDCSGFVRAVYAEYGLDLPRTSRDQARIGADVGRDNIQPGDLLFFTERPGGGRIHHVAIALGGGRMIHASSGRGRVVVDPISKRYFRRRLHAVRRVLFRAPARPDDTATAAVHEPLGPLPCVDTRCP